VIREEAERPAPIRRICFMGIYYWSAKIREK
jgi:hypothetical protein